MLRRLVGFILFVDIREAKGSAGAIRFPHVEVY